MALGTLTSESEWRQINVDFAIFTGYCDLVILTVRVWAIWNRNRRLLISLCCLTAVIWTPGLAGLCVFFTRTICTPSNPSFENTELMPNSFPPVDYPTPIFKGYKGCLPMKTSKLIIWWWAALCAWDFCEHKLFISYDAPASNLAYHSMLGFGCKACSTIPYVFFIVSSSQNGFKHSSTSRSSRNVLQNAHVARRVSGWLYLHFALPSQWWKLISELLGILFYICLFRKLSWGYLVLPVIKHQ